MKERKYEDNFDVSDDSKDLELSHRKDTEFALRDEDSESKDIKTLE